MAVSVLARADDPQRLRELPRIDYASHPAYGGMFPPGGPGGQAETELRGLVAEVEQEEARRAAAFGYRHGTGTDVSREVAAEGWCVRQLPKVRLERLRAAHEAWMPAYMAG